MKLFLAQVALYTFICWNVREVAQGGLQGALVSDAFIATLNYWIVRDIVRKGRSKFFWYLAASLVGTWIGVRWLQ